MHSRHPWYPMEERESLEQTPLDERGRRNQAEAPPR